MNQKKLALLGNMNNNFFSLGRYLKFYGYEVELFVGEHNFEHFTPRADTHSLNFSTWVKETNWGRQYQFNKTDFQKVRKELSSFSLISSSGLMLATLEKAGISSDVYTPYGWDIWQNTRLIPKSRPDKILASINSSFWMRRGLKNCDVMHMPRMADMYETRVAKFFHGNHRWQFGWPCVYQPDYDGLKRGEWPYSTHWREEFLNLRRGSDFLVLAPSRHVWIKTERNAISPASKGNEMYLRAWSEFLKITKTKNPKLILIEYGSDVNRSKELISELDIGDSISWLPQMYRKDLMCGYIQADVIFGEFIHSWSTGGVIFEALAIGRPLIMKYDFGDTDSAENQLPVLPAGTEQEIVDQLLLMENEKEYRSVLEEVSKNWYQSQVVYRTIEAYENALR